MTTPAFRALAALAFAAALAACSGGMGVTPSTATPSIARVSGFVPARGFAPAAAVVPAATSTPYPCAIQHGWTFHAGCTEIPQLWDTPTTVKFPSYHGLRIATEFTGRNQTASGRAFVVGIGTSDADITGRSSSGIFPVYGSGKGCTDTQGVKLKCRGKGFLYELLMNPSTNSFSMGFTYSPIWRITNANPFSGTQCQAAMLVKTGNGWYWAELPQVVTPKNGVISFKIYEWILSLDPGYLEVVGFHCF